MKVAMCLIALGICAEGIKINAVARKGGWPWKSEEEIDEQCRREKEEMLRKAQHDFDVSDAEYRRQKKILADNEADHKSEVADVKAQEKVVSKEEVDVKDAAAVVKENEHCPPELEKAEAELSKLLAEPNSSPEDIEAECKAEKRVLKYKACVEKLRAAEAKLAQEHSEHSQEKSDLGHEVNQADSAERKIPPQEGNVADAKADLDAKRKRLEEVKAGMD